MGTAGAAGRWKLTIDMKKKPASGSFWTDILKLATGTVIAQAMSTLLSPVLSRLFSPTAFGLVGLFSALTYMIGSVACLRYDVTVLLPEKKEDATHQLTISLLADLVVTAGCALVVWAWGAPVAALFNSPGLVPYLWMLPVATFMYGIYYALNYWISRARQYFRLSLARILNSTAMNAWQLGSGLLNGDAGGLIFGNVLGLSINSIVMAADVLRVDWQFMRSHLTFSGLMKGIKRYKNFPLLDTWATLVSSSAGQIAFFLLGIFFSSQEIGYYNLGYRVLRFPMLLVGAAIAQVFYQRAAAAKHDPALANTTEELLRWLLWVVAMPMLVLGVAGKQIFVVIFGAPWAEAGVYTQILSLWSLGFFLAGTFAPLFSVYERQRANFITNLALLIATVAAMAIGALANSPRLGLALVGVSGTIIYLVSTGWLIHLTGLSYARMLDVLWKTLRLCLPWLALLGVGVWLEGGNNWIVTGASAAVCGGYYFFLVFKNPEFKVKEFLALMKAGK